jgi:hypothetical protein
MWRDPTLFLPKRIIRCVATVAEIDVDIAPTGKKRDLNNSRLTAKILQHFAGRYFLSSRLKGFRIIDTIPTGVGGFLFLGP